MAAALFIQGCAHVSKIKPSNGHIDGQNPPQKNTTTSNNQAAADAAIPKPIKSIPYLPPPQAKVKPQTYSVVVNEVPVKEILFALARESKLNIDIHPSIQGRVTLNAVDQTLPAILERLSKQVDLTYKMEGNVLSITPDQPVLRTYKIDYVNITRDTDSSISSDGAIATSGQSTSTGAGGSSSSTSTSSGNGANNGSSTSVKSKSKNHLWESLIENIKQLLAETDKEVIVTRIGSAPSATPIVAGGSAATQASAQADVKAAAEEREQQKSEYKTLFAANVIANPETGVISVRATSKQHEKVQEFIDKVMSSARRQVLIEATIVEVQLNDGYQAGIDWSRLGNPGSSSGFTFSQRLNSSNFTPGDLQTRATGLGLVAGYFNPASALGNIAASINLLKQFGDTKVLSSPKLMVLNNQTAVLKVVDNLVYFTVQAQQSQAAVGGGVLSTVTTTPNTVPVGIVMSVTPQINEVGNVNINVRPTISSLIRYVPDPNPNLVAINNQGIPEIQVREMESLLQIASGNTAILGGLMQDVIKKNTDKVPGLSEIPGVGAVFTGRDDSNKKTELVIFLRPTVITNASLESDELQSYKQYLPSQQLQNVLDESSN